MLNDNPIDPILLATNLQESRELYVPILRDQTSAEGRWT
jgi:hypothetical protein